MNETAVNGRAIVGHAMNQGAKTIVLYLLRAYKWAISPMFSPACRYVPTCSEYAVEAVQRYGAWRGGLMSIKRLLRCHPLACSGYDPVVKPKDYARVDVLPPRNCAVTE
jgi:putative membrane protein insertion efficiency factor